ncbi:MAG: glycosyltransferase [Rhodospirillaceae bacterium]|nr:MAG: glycosyltransferase [Rhodospirillaceae bacterium]
MSRRLDIGVASYRNPEKLRATLASIEAMSTTDWSCVVVHNPSADEAGNQALQIILDHVSRDPRYSIIQPVSNAGYAGAVNLILAHAQSEYIAYLDNDVEILTPGWDETLCSYLDRFHEIGIIFPNGGAYMIPRGPYTEVQWAAGFAWVMNRLCHAEVGGMDETIGHQNECDLALRIRMAGWKCAGAPEVRIAHHATATSDPAANERIARGVREFVDKWTRYFGGKNLNYHSPNVLRWEDWHPNALYMEEWWKLQRGESCEEGLMCRFDIRELNDSPEVITVEGRDYDLIRVPRFNGFYRGRVI